MPVQNTWVERFVVENARRYLVCRAGWMMGSGPGKDKKFIQKIMKQIKDGKKELFIVNDKDGTPDLYSRFCQRQWKSLLEQKSFGGFTIAFAAARPKPVGSCTGT